MKWPNQWIDAHRTIARANWLRRRDVRDGSALVVVAILAYLLANLFDLPRKIFRVALEYQRWEIDDLLFVGFVLSVAGSIYGLRRYSDFSREMRARLKAQLEARKLTGHDHLTGLPNRRFLEERLDHELGIRSHGERLAILILDIDGFKRVLDLRGHAIADTVLVECAERISVLLRENCVLARVGGDTFAILMSRIRSLDEPIELGHRMLTAMSRPFVMDTATVNIGISIGIAVAPGDGATSRELTKRAERALYRAKSEDRSSIRFFEPEMDARVERRILVERELRKAIDSHTIVPHYQPFVSLEENRIIGFEALARWDSEILGRVSPELFIPLAEEIGLIGELGNQLFCRACNDAKNWPTDLTLAFNVSAIQLRDQTFAAHMLNVLRHSGFSPDRLEIEITESALVDHVAEAALAMNQLRDKGVRIVLDDFGTGYATLAQLFSFPLNKIKIDRSFVVNIVEDHDRLVVVRAIVGLAAGLGLTAIAEGIENVEQLACLKENGCAEGQGYWFGLAVPAEDVEYVLARDMPESTADEKPFRVP